MFHPQLKEGVCREQSILVYGLNLLLFRGLAKTDKFVSLPTPPTHTHPAEFVYQTTYTFIFKCHNGNIYDQYLVEGSSLSAAQLYLEQHSVQSEIRLYVLSSRERYNTLVKA